MDAKVSMSSAYVLPRQEGTLHWIEFKDGMGEGHRVRFLYDHRPKKRTVPFIAVARIEENIDGTWTGCAVHVARMVRDEGFADPDWRSHEFQDYASEEEAKVACQAAYLLTYGKE